MKSDRYQQLPSGILIPVDPPHPYRPNNTGHKTADEYYLDHQRCPNCGSEDLCQTCVGYPVPECHDGNLVDCLDCKWDGRVYDLVSASVVPRLYEQTPPITDTTTKLSARDKPIKTP